MIAATARICLWLRQGCNLRRLSSTTYLVTEQAREPIVVPSTEALVEWTKRYLPSQPLKEETFVFETEMAKQFVEKSNEKKKKKADESTALEELNI
ncbi:hypothetical protein KZZ20_10435 [Methylacidiphilum fumariolicum]|nr:hypothetical protein [Candidatus Methylacidiphilum fumarolicum]MBW6415919.1 hypothetical protein [Candidatus Methylacidiphilum fumarolicum]TFE75688.1 hypothetical protein A7D33_10830 [Candidatus Methylacidiphilum fumarolicum]